MKFGITGGIGSGKSFVCKRLQLRGIDVYDCDAAAKRLINTDADIRRKLTALIGPEAYMSVPNGSIVGTTPTVLNKAAVARFLLDSESNAKAIDDIVHPAVFRDFQESGIEWMRVPSCTSRASTGWSIVSSWLLPLLRYASNVS